MCARHLFYVNSYIINYPLCRFSFILRRLFDSLTTKINNMFINQIHRLLFPQQIWTSILGLSIGYFHRFFKNKLGINKCLPVRYSDLWGPLPTRSGIASLEIVEMFCYKNIKTYLESQYLYCDPVYYTKVANFIMMYYTETKIYKKEKKVPIRPLRAVLFFP